MRKLIAALAVMASLVVFAPPAQAAAPNCFVGTSVSQFNVTGSDITIRYMGALSACTKALYPNYNSYTLNVKAFADNVLIRETTVHRGCVYTYKWPCGVSVIWYITFSNVCPDNNTPWQETFSTEVTGSWIGHVETVTASYTASCVEIGGGD